MTRRVDARGRVRLPSDFANQTVIVERVSENEVRVRKARVARKRKYRLKELMAQITDENIHRFADAGPLVGNEAL